SDIIKDEFFEYDLEDALGVVCNSKAYFIMPSKITGTQKVFVYDIASSTRLGTTIWYFYDNFIQSNISSGEITCIENLGGDLYICQGGDAYYEYTNNSDSQYVNLTNLYLETQRLNNGDSIRKKIWRRIKIDFTPVGRVTEFKIYASFDGGAYQLIKTSNLFEIQAFFTKISTDIKVKIEITQSGTISTSSILEFLRMEIEYEPITKQ
ncbi:hypothetical protein EOM39_07825, partial [Candidatus Gracilibacteria bacterium]|nr:hypothetical protein [Candidatus Gracilibacteria bacterium]